MEMRQIQITVPEGIIEALKETAREQGITPNMAARIILTERFCRKNYDKRVYRLTLEEPQEIEAYVKAKRLGSVSNFAQYAMELAMSRAPLTEAQKRRVDTTGDK